MNKERIKGAAQKLKGRIETKVGQLLGSKKIETDGKIDTAAGSIRSGVGELNDIVEDAAEDAAKSSRK